MKWTFPALLLLVGCASYEYDITRPPEHVRHVGTKAEERFTRDPLEYRLKTVDSRLVMLIFNHTEQPIQLLGDRSSAVDEKGQSHPLRPVAIAPQSYIKVILPPLRPYIERTGPSIGIGVGGMFGSGRPYRYGWGAYHYYDEPRYLAIVDDNSLYWDWNGETEVRLTLVYQQGEKIIEHDFVIARRKV
jgi:hypothetical protein